jgi:hypothetical protein
VRRQAIAGLLLVLAVALDVWATAALAGAMGPANDLFPRWYGTRAWLLEGLDPYAPAVSEGIRQAMGAAPGEALGAFVFGFVYPGYVALLLVPLALLPFSWAATIWLLLAQVATGLGAWLAWRAAEREEGRPGASALPALLVALCFPASLLNLTFGQFAALVFAALAGAWYLLGRVRRPASVRGGTSGLAGALLALAFVKPSVALLPAGALLLWCWGHGRGRAVATAAVALGLLAGASLVLLPGWPPGWPVAFWRSTVEYARVASATSAAGLVAALLGRAAGGQVLPPAATAAVAVLAAATVAAGWLVSPRRAGDALGAGVLLGAWLVPPLYEWSSVLLLLPLLGWLRRRPAGARARPGLVLATAGLVLANVASLPLVLRWPYESRALWPALVLAAWGAVAVCRFRRYLGTKKVTLRSAGSSPSSPALT